jgi:predicted DNA-binding transcriptional regulator AlpA
MVEGRTRIEAPTRLMTVGKAAALIGMSPRWVDRHARELPFPKRVARAVRVDGNAVANSIESRGAN